MSAFWAKVSRSLEPPSARARGMRVAVLPGAATARALTRPSPSAGGRDPREPKSWPAMPSGRPWVPPEKWRTYHDRCAYWPLYLPLPRGVPPYLDSETFGVNRR